MDKNLKFPWLYVRCDQLNLSNRKRTKSTPSLSPSAIEGEADFIISGDHHLLNLKTYQDIEIVNAAKFISIWRETDETNNK